MTNPSFTTRLRRLCLLAYVRFWLSLRPMMRLHFKRCSVMDRSGELKSHSPNKHVLMDSPKPSSLVKNSLETGVAHLFWVTTFFTAQGLVLSCKAEPTQQGERYSPTEYRTQANMELSNLMTVVVQFQLKKSPLYLSLLMQYPDCIFMTTRLLILQRM